MKKTEPKKGKKPLGKTPFIQGGEYSNFILGITGILVFVGGPYLANTIHKPITASLLNVIPTGYFMLPFITRDEFPNVLYGLIFAPTLNVVLNFITYMLFIYIKLEPMHCVVFNISCWLLIALASYFFY